MSLRDFRPVSLATRWLIVAPAVMTIACGGQTCGSGPAPGSSSTAPGSAAPAPGAASGTPAVAANTGTLGQFADLRNRMSAALGGGNRDLTPADTAARLAAILEEMRAARNRVDRSRFDPAFVVRTAGSDPTALFAWVRDSTRLVPYRGRLRGPVGVLMDRAGNSLDRSLLLAELLKSAGHEARLARGTMPPAEAARILATLRLPVSAGSSTSHAEEDAFYDRYAERFGTSAADLKKTAEAWRGAADTLGQTVTERSIAQTAVLRQVLGDALGRAADAAEAARLEGLKDHWWVQVRQGNVWSDLDPVLMPQPGGKPVLTPASSMAANALPDDVHHSVRIRLVIERATSAGLQTAPVLEHDLRSADVVGMPITLTQLPVGMSADANSATQPDARARLRQLLVGATEWIPVLAIGATQVAKSQFTIAGEVNAAAPPGRRPASVGRPSGGLVDAFGGGDDPPDGRLTAQFLEYEIRSPGLPVRTERRTVFDWVGAARRSQGVTAPTSVQIPADGALQVVGETALAILGSQMSSDYVDQLSILEMIEQFDVTRTALLDKQAATDAVTKIMRRPTARPDLRLYALAVGRDRWRPANAPVFVARPNVFTIHKGISPKADADLASWAAFDIVVNDVDSLSTGAAAASARLAQGVLDSNAEALVAETSPSAPGVSELMHTGRMDAAQWFVVARSTDVPAGLQLAPNLRARLDATLQQGKLVVFPKDIAKMPADHAGWWQVDAATGSTVGIDSRGWGGQALVEVKVADMIGYLVGMVLSASCFAEAASLAAASSGWANACRFTACVGELVGLHVGFFAVKFAWAAASFGGISLASKGCGML